MKHLDLWPKKLYSELEEYREIFGKDFSLMALIEIRNADSRMTIADSMEKIAKAIPEHSDVLARAIDKLSGNVLSAAPEHGIAKALCAISDSIESVADAVSDMPIGEIAENTDIIADFFEDDYIDEDEEDDPDL